MKDVKYVHKNLELFKLLKYLVASMCYKLLISIRCIALLSGNFQKNIYTKALDHFLVHFGDTYHNYGIFRTKYKSTFIVLIDLSFVHFH